ncbi:polyamine aminopropyltransferase [Alicyclobacillus sp. SO9]|uniref:polyamine aminopropyltransferase n=1 Tax=Alicyclobacillus sp. SO9 TaxID=2665646 RepID=UPI0018E89E37|nr:polyamine aminopropyltransferase [Alicyclobacillus sp. SO9]QQE76883.1 polyamine aminopropyltransferase [Alicyclobacillus sp. SO9]
MDKTTGRTIRNVSIASAAVSICGIVFQVLFGAVGSYAFGDSVATYAWTIGLFLSGMGLGSLASEKIIKNLASRFVQVEFGVALTGGTSSFFMFMILAYFGVPTAEFYLRLVTFGVGALTGLELPILIRKAQEMGQTVNKSTSRILFADYAGSLAGAIAFVLILRPWLGMVKTAFLIGTVNALIAIWVTYLFRDELKLRRWVYQGTGIAIVVLLVAGFLVGDKYTAGFEQKMYADPIVASIQTKYQKIVLTKRANDVRLYLNGNIQFSSSDQYRYHEALVDPIMSLTPSHKSILVVGGGDGIAVNRLLKYKGVRHITLVDLDPKMTHFAMTNPYMTKINHKSLLNPKVTVIHEDAFKYLGTHHSHLYDDIIIDLPDPNNESLNKLYTRTFYTFVRNHLEPNGYMVCQSTSPLFARKAFWTIVDTVHSVGLHARGYHVDVPSFGDWGFTIASRQPIDISKMHLEIPTKFLTQALLPKMFVFGKDENSHMLVNGKPVRWVPNTLNHPILLRYYNDAWKYYH